MADMMICGEKVAFSTDCSQTGCNNNSMCIGGSGSGKTRSFMEPVLLETQRASVVVSASKRGVIDRFLPVFQKRGYKTIVINFVNPEQSQCGFNPLLSVHGQQGIHALADSCEEASGVRDGKGSNDPFWDNSAISLLEASLSYEMYLNSPSMGRAVERITKMTIESRDGGDAFVTSLDKQFERLALRHPDSCAVVRWNAFRSLPFRTASCVLNTLTSALSYFFTPELLHMLQSKEPIHFSQIGQEKTAVFVYTSAVSPALNHFSKLFYSEAIKDLFNYAESRSDGILPIPVNFLFDDFANGGRIQDFPEYISIFREKGISVSLLIQSESQLRSMYGDDDAVTIINNCDTQIYMGGTDITTCESVSKRANVPFHQVYTMPVGMEYVFRRGEEPILTKRYDIFHDPQYQSEVMAEYNRKCAETDDGQQFIDIF